MEKSIYLSNIFFILIKDCSCDTLPTNPIKDKEKFIFIESEVLRFIEKLHVESYTLKSNSIDLLYKNGFDEVIK